MKFIVTRKIIVSKCGTHHIQTIAANAKQKKNQKKK